MRRRLEVFAAFVCFGLLGPAASATDDLKAVSFAGLTFHIPTAYVFSLPNPPVSYLRIVAKLPCLAPLTPEEKDEYLQSKRGAEHFLSASLNPFSDNPYVVGKAWVQKELEQSHQFIEFERAQHSDDPAIQAQIGAVVHADLGPTPIPGSRKFVTYHNLLLRNDIFVSSGDDPLVVDCDQHGEGIRFVPNGMCTVQERALDTVHLWYWYERSVIDGNIDNAAMIDDNLKRLLASFLMPNLGKPGETSCN